MSKIKRKILLGKVLKAKMQKTVVVQVERTVIHPRYKKVIRKYSKFKVHDEQGIAKTDVVTVQGGAIITKGNDSTVIPSQESKFEWTESAYLANKIYLYTDKPIYRPGQEVFIKGIYRIGFDGSYEIYQEKKINLKI
ncbi:MAG: 30S ribosomal protein S17 [Candidatus Omnitrophica bacterium]|nr:30S ribosomal protein S17 [Candidatus Omnitrophota bacterium]